MNDSPFDLSALLRPFLPADGAPVAVAVSGGPDSMALCRALSLCAAGPVHVLTVDHGLRPESALEAAEVGRRIAGWPHVHHTVLKREGGGATRIQEEARFDRYALMAGYCEQHGIERLFTAHHQDDQAETFLFRLAKGSGLDGLGAMRPVHAYNGRLQIIRPFLDVPKAALVSFCEGQGVAFTADPSNENTSFARVRLRRARAVLEAEGLTAKRLCVTAKRLARAREALDFYAQNLLSTAGHDLKSNRIVLSLVKVENQPEEVRLRVLSGMMEKVAGRQEYGPRMERLEELCARLFSDAGFRKFSLGGCLVSLDRKKGLIAVEKEQKKVS